MKKWIEAARLRTLPLSLSGIFTGFALSQSFANFHLFILCVLTAISLQILSNFANDFGDFSKGTDNENRVGPARTMQKGLITKKEMKKMLFIFGFLSFGLGVSTSVLAFNISFLTFVFIFIGAACVLAAITYTMGKNAYGYLGLGDVFVFLFFGLVSVLGTKYVLTKDFDLLDLLPAISIGLLSASVLNLNNMRDIENDTFQNKKTIVTKMGLENALIYHFVIVVTALSAIGLYSFLTGKNSILSYLIFFIFPLFNFHLVRLYKKGLDTDFDPELKKVAIPTFLLSILFVVQEFLK